MGFFDSESSTDQKAAETGAQTQEGNAFSLSNQGRIVADDGSTLTINATDHGLTDQAFALADDVMQYSAGATEAVIEQTNKNAELAAKQSAEARRDALDYGRKTTNRAMKTVDQTVNSALMFSAGAAELAAATQADAMKSVNQAAAQNALSSKEARESALQYGAGAFTAAVAAADRASDAQASAFSQALAYTKGAAEQLIQSTESEGKKLTDQMVYAVVALVAVMAWRASK